MAAMAVLLWAGATLYACSKENTASESGASVSEVVLRDNAIDTVADDWSHLATDSLSFTQCRSQSSEAKYTMINQDTVEVSVSEGVLYVSHRHMVVNCGYDTVVAEIKLIDDTIAIHEKEVCYDYMTRCLCNTDVAYQVTGIPRGRYAVKVWDGYGYSVYYKGSIVIE